MYLHLGNNIAVPMDDIIGIFDLDNASTARSTKSFLRTAEEEGMVTAVGGDLPKSLVVCCPRGSWQRVYVSPLTPQTLLGRLEDSPFAARSRQDAKEEQYERVQRNQNTVEGP